MVLFVEFTARDVKLSHGNVWMMYTWEFFTIRFRNKIVSRVATKLMTVDIVLQAN